MEATSRPAELDRSAAGALPGAGVAALAVLGVVKVTVHVLTSASYGFHGDELYFLASGRHLALGYVDFPPVTPLLARLSMALFGPSVFGLRLFSALAGAAIVVLAGLMARELGGGRFAQALSAGAALACPLLLGANWMFHTTDFDQLTWSIALLVAARLARTGEARWWLALGVALGVGLETKYTILALCLGLVVGALATPARRHLRTPWPWLGALVALLILVPNLVWQVQHGWISVAYITGHSQQSQGTSPPAYLAEQLLAVGPLAVPLWLAGWYRLLRSPEFRMLGVAALVPFVVFLFAGKAYYPGPLYPLVLAAGAVGVEAFSRRRWRSTRPAVVTAVVLDGLLLLPIAIPLVPTSRLHATGLDASRHDFAETVGWPELTDQVATVYNALPSDERAHTLILASHYMEAGAVDLYGPSRGLPAAICPHLTYWYWKPAHTDDRTVVVVGMPRAEVERYFASVEPAATIATPDGVENDQSGEEILVARQPRVSLDQVWPQLRTLA